MAALKLLVQFFAFLAFLSVKVDGKFQKPQPIVKSRQEFGNGKGNEFLNVISRIPKTTVSTAQISFQSFFSTALMILPIGIIFNLRTKPFVFGTVLNNGFKMATSWGGISACYAGGEELVRGLRGKSDRWNMYLGSAFASSVMKISEGPIPVIQGFVFGFLFVYVLDEFMLSSTTVGDDSTSVRKNGMSARRTVS